MEAQAAENELPDQDWEEEKKSAEEVENTFNLNNDDHHFKNKIIITTIT